MAPNGDANADGDPNGERDAETGPATETDPETGRRRTTTHGLIRSEVEERGGYPAHESQTEGEGDSGLLTVADRDDEADHEEITWEQFFEEFEEKDLAYVYPDGDGVGSLKKRSGRD